MINIIQAVILGIIQGITEWLPISSSGHLVLFQHFMNIDVPVAFDVMLHLGTLIVILLIYKDDLIAILRSLFAWKWDKNTRLLVFLMIGSIPTAIAGIFLRDFFKSMFEGTLVVGLGLLFTSLLLFLSKFGKEKKDLNLKNAFVIGIAQSIAIFPGVSRSGSTISTGLILGAKRKDLARYSFLLLIPAVLGASIFELSELRTVPIVPIIAGTLTSIIVGYISLKWLLRLIQKDKFHYFSYYCLALGIIVLVMNFI
ncbi:MAG: undecaprenyl-diphosphate phosphatase [Candidatus Woesearchaeota archaeon]